MTEEKAPTNISPKWKLVQVPDNIRVRAHWYEGILTLLFLLSIVTRYTVTDDYTIPEPLFAVSSTTHYYILWITAVTAAIGFLCLLVSGASPSMWLYRVRWVSPDSMKPEALANAVKWLILMVLSTVSFGCLPLLILVLTKDERGRTILDRGCETWCVYEEPVTGTKKDATDEKRESRQHPTAEQSTRPTQATTTERTEAANLRAAFYPVANETRDEEVDDVEQTDDTHLADEADANAEQILEDSTPALDHRDTAAPVEADEESLDNQNEPAPRNQEEPGSEQDEEKGEALALVEDETPIVQEPEPKPRHRADEQQPRNPIALIFDDGTHWDLVCPLVVGRDPEVFKRCEDAALLAINDEARSVSKTHLLVELKDGKVYVEDLQSTNGVKLILTDQREEKLRPNVAVSVEPGTQVVFGQRHFLVSE